MRNVRIRRGLAIGVGWLVTPCCDDHTMVKCCCEQGAVVCNIVLSGKGLAAYLIREMGFDADQVRDSVFQWLRFARSDYYLARELEERNVDPEDYGLTTYGSCYRSMCSVPIRQGGCGGMGELIEPSIETTDAG